MLCTNAAAGISTSCEVMTASCTTTRTVDASSACAAVPPTAAIKKIARKIFIRVCNDSKFRNAEGQGPAERMENGKFVSVPKRDVARIYIHHKNATRPPEALFCKLTIPKNVGPSAFPPACPPKTKRSQLPL